MPNWKKLIISGSDASLKSLTVTNGVTGSLLGTALSASYVNTLNQNVLITGSVTIGSSSLGPSENTLTLGARDSVNEGGQIGFNAPGGTYTSASFIDLYQNRLRILRGNNAGSDAEVAWWNMHSKQLALPAYTNASSFTGTATANLAVDSSGNVITVSTTGGTVFPYVGNAVITGSLTTTGIIYAQPNGGMYFQGGDDAALYDINVANTMGIYGVQDSTVGAVKLGSNGPVLYGSGSKLGIGTTNPSSASLTVNGNVWATSFTGSLSGTASTASFTPNALVTASVSSNTITFTKGNGSTFNLTVDTGSGGGGGTPGGSAYHVQVNNGTSGFYGDQYFQYKWQDQKIIIENTTDPVNNPLTNDNFYTTERYNSFNSIAVDSINYQFTNAQFPYSLYLTNGVSTPILQIDTNAGTGLGPGLQAHAFKCDYTLVSLNASDILVRGTRTGTLYCVWDEDKASYNPVITDTTLTSTSGASMDKLDDAVFTVAWNSSKIELSLDTTLCNGNIVFNGLFTIFSMR